MNLLNRGMLVPAMCAVVVFGGLAMFQGCSSPSGGGNGTPDVPELPDVEGPAPLEFTEQDGQTVTQTVSTKSGATVASAGDVSAALEIPPGALPQDAEVSLTVLTDPTQDEYTLLVLFEPDGLELDEAATLVITLDPPLPVGSALDLLEVSGTDPDAFVDTGMLAEVSADGSEVRITVEHFSGTGCRLNCHGHSVRRIVQGLQRRGMTKDQIIAQIRSTVGDALAVGGQSVDDAYDDLSQNYDRLGDFRSCPAEPPELLAYLNTFYSLATVRLNAEYAGGGVTLDETTEDCLEQLDELTRSSDLPPILNIGRQFTVSGGSPESGLAMILATGFALISPAVTVTA